MYSPHSFDILIAAHHADLLREASNERLARARPVIRRPRVRSRMAEALYALAVRLDPCAVQCAAPVSRPA